MEDKVLPGVIEARASKHDNVVLIERRETAEIPAKIVAVADRATINADGQDIAVINVSIVDAKGRAHPLADNKVSFAIDGPGAVIGVGNGNQSSHEADKPVTPAAAERSAFNGLCMAIVQTRRGEPGTITVRISAEGLDPATVRLHSI